MLSGSTSARHSSDFGPSAALTPRKNCISPHYLSPLLRKISSSSDSDIRSSQPMHLQLSSSSEQIASVSFAQRTFRWEVQRSALFFNGAQQVCAWMSYSDKLFWLHEYRVRSFSAVIDCCQNKRIPDRTNAANVNSKRYRNRHSQICHNLTFGSLKYSSLHESQRRLAWNLRERFEISKILAEEEVWGHIWGSFWRAFTQRFLRVPSGFPYPTFPATINPHFIGRSRQLSAFSNFACCTPYSP